MSRALEPGWAVVTGASSGIGAAFAEELGQLGYSVALVGRSLADLDRVSRRVRGRSRVLATDLAAGPSDELLHVASGADGPVALLVNNAGSGTFGPFDQQQPSELAETISVNVGALVQLTRSALPAMIERGSGGVINVSSSASDMAAPGAAVYVASKAAVDSFSRSLRREVRRRGVVITCVRPGYTRTAFHGRSGQGPGSPTERWQDPEHVARAALGAHRAGRAVVTVPRYGPIDWARRHTGDLAELVPESLRHALRRSEALIGRRTAPDAVEPTADRSDSTGRRS